MMSGTSNVNGLIYEPSLSEFALINNSQITGTDDVVLSANIFDNLNIGNILGNSTVVIGSASCTETISTIGSGVLNLACSGLRISALTG